MATSHTPRRLLSGGSELLTRADVCALIITYHPDPAIRERIAAVLPQVGSLVVVDNNSSPQILQSLSRLAKCEGFELICNEENLGVARALNQGFGWAKTHGYQWVLSLDDDTEVESFMVDALLTVYNAAEHRDKIALVGSTFCRKEQKRQVTAITKSDGWQSVKHVITSGTLTSMVAYEKIGPFRDSFFIDHVDNEYSARARSRGYQVIKSLRLTMCHSIGAPSYHKLLWVRTETSNHSPTRRYYSVRNLTIMAREFYKFDFFWILHAIVASCKAVVLLCIFEKGRRSKLKMIWKGFRDGIRFDLRRSGHLGEHASIQL